MNPADLTAIRTSILTADTSTMSGAERDWYRACVALLAEVDRLTPAPKPELPPIDELPMVVGRTWGRFYGTALFHSLAKYNDEHFPACGRVMPRRYMTHAVTTQSRPCAACLALAKSSEQP